MAERLNGSSVYRRMFWLRRRLNRNADREAVVILAFVGGILWGINSVLFIVELCK